MNGPYTWSSATNKCHSYLNYFFVTAASKVVEQLRKTCAGKQIPTKIDTNCNFTVPPLTIPQSYVVSLMVNFNQLPSNS